MKEHDFQEEVMKILQEAPSARRALLENHDNLLNVSEYCANNYMQSGEDTSKALEETKNFTTQSLASVAYQISTLASSVLSLLDAQTNQLRHMESSVNLIGQTVEMHKEKVSRREIGAFTAVRRVPRSHKILPPPPASSQPRPAYSRRPINYQQLDGLGHGVKVSGKQSDRTGTIRKHGASIRCAKPPEPVHCPVAPSVSGSSFGKAVAPPTIPITCSTPPECDIITTLLDDTLTPPPTANETSAVSDELNNSPDLSEETVAPPLPPPPPPPPPLDVLTNHSSSPLAPPLLLETVEEESSLLSPSPPPPPPLSDEDSLPLIPSEGSEIPAPPPPPLANQEGDVTLLSRRSRHRRSPPASRSVSLRVRSGPASRCRFTRSLFLPAVQSLMIPPPPPYPPPHAPPLLSFASSPRLRLPARLEHLDLEIPVPPPPLLLDNERGCDDNMPTLPPPMDYDISAPPQYLDKVVALYSYEASKPDDLSLTEGDIVYLTHRHDNGWCEGVLHGNRGFFPENYVQSCG